MVAQTGRAESFTSSTMASEATLKESSAKPKRPSLVSRFGSSRRFLGNLVGRLSSSKLAGDGWVCEHCTFKNQKVDFLSCEICGMIRRSLSTNIEEDLQLVENENEPQQALTTKTQGKMDPEDPRFLSASMEQETALRNSKNDCEDQDLQVLIEMRMQEIVDRQRELYDEIAEHRVRRSSITYHLETQKSIDRLQDIIQQHQHDDESNDDGAVDKDNGEEEEEEKTEIEPIRPPTAMFTPKMPERKIAPGSTRSALIKKQASRRQLRKAQQYENPVNTMSTNPWEEKSVGLNDLLEVQSELWDRVKAEPKPGPKPPPGHQPNGPRFQRNRDRK